MFLFPPELFPEPLLLFLVQGVSSFYWNLSPAILLYNKFALI